MGNKFFDYIQPTIIRASFDEELPENVRGRFFINFNVFGIKYFQENYILTENTYGTPYLILKEDAWGFELEDSGDGEILDVPRIYIDITDEFINDDGGVFQSFVFQSMMEERIWAIGIDNFMSGHQYYLNYTLYNYLANTNQIETPIFGSRLPNYLDERCNITKYWIDLKDEVYKDYSNIEYFNEKNNLLTNTFSEEELNNFYSNFCNIILKHTKITPEMMAAGNNPIYKLVLDYYAGFQSDCASNAIGLILNSLYGTTTTTGCGCNNTKTNEVYSTQTCGELYANAMGLYLKQMLSDAEFYQDWFMIYETDKKYIVNDVLTETLIKFINEFVSIQNALTFIKTGYRRNCDCPVITLDENNCNYQIIANYLHVLDYVDRDVVKANTNKIKIFGGQFAELLPKLQF